MPGPRLELSNSTQHAFLAPSPYYCTCTMCRTQVRGQQHLRHRAQVLWRRQSCGRDQLINKETGTVVWVAKGNRDVGTSCALVHLTDELLEPSARARVIYGPGAQHRAGLGICPQRLEKRGISPLGPKSLSGYFPQASHQPSLGGPVG